MRNKNGDTQKSNELTQTNKPRDTVRFNSLSITLFIVFFALGIGGVIWMDDNDMATLWMIVWGTIMGVLALFFLTSLKIANQWEKVVLLRMGKFHGLRGPGLFWIRPLVDTTPSWIDLVLVLD